MVLAGWDDWERVHAAFAESWSYVYSADGPALSVRGYRAGSPWLELELGPPADDSDFDLEELLDEHGLYPDGSPGPTLVLEQSWASLAGAEAAGFLTPELAAWLRAALEGRPSVRQVARRLPARLGFSVRRWLCPEDLGQRGADEWDTDEWGRGARVVSGVSGLQTS